MGCYFLVCSCLNLLHYLWPGARVPWRRCVDIILSDDQVESETERCQVEPVASDALNP